MIITLPSPTAKYDTTALQEEGDKLDLLIRQLQDKRLDLSLTVEYVNRIAEYYDRTFRFYVNSDPYVVEVLANQNYNVFEIASTIQDNLVFNGWTALWGTCKLSYKHLTLNCTHGAIKTERGYYDIYDLSNTLPIYEDNNAVIHQYSRP